MPPKHLFLSVLMTLIIISHGYGQPTSPLGSSRLDTSSLNENQISILKKDISFLNTLRTGNLAINKEVYQLTTRFKKLFKFDFSGKNLVEWLLKRIKKVSVKNSWTVATIQNNGHLILKENFFNKLSRLERLYVLIHEARHADSSGFPHIKCPKDFPFVSAGQPLFLLPGAKACDNSLNGAYSFQAAFLFEVYAFSLLDQKSAGLIYNTTVTRIIPLMK